MVQLPEMEHPLEFVACFGDDRADEDTFAAINAQIVARELDIVGEGDLDEWDSDSWWMDLRKGELEPKWLRMVA